MERFERQQTEKLERMWEPKEGFLRRFLISRTRDIDLADDLLQETYLCAAAGLRAYRGADSRAWLTTIAKNLAARHAGRRYVRSEVPLEQAEIVSPNTEPGSLDHLDRLNIRQAIDGLSPLLRDALILKHYGGLTYQEIAQRLGCPVGTAKRRVWDAIQQMKAALGAVGKDVRTMKCKDLRGGRLLDYVYGTISAEDKAAVEEHLRACAGCREQVEAVRNTIQALDELRDEAVLTDIFKLAEDGSATVYCSSRWRNDTERPVDHYEVSSCTYNHGDYVFILGEELGLETHRCEEDQRYNDHVAKLRRPLQPGEETDVWYVYHTDPGGPNAAQDLKDGRWVMVPDNSCVDREFLRVLVVRLPEAGCYLGSVPPADEVRENNSVALVWRGIVRVGEVFQRPVIVYSAGNGG